MAHLKPMEYSKMTNRRNFLNAGLALSMVPMTSLPAFAETTNLRSGTFEGRSNHVTTGGVSVFEKDGRVFVELAEDFSLDGGPDPRVAFGNNGKVDKATYLGTLVSLNGKQLYALPPTIENRNYSEVYIFCDVAGVPLGVASIK